jgi:nucleotide-binding universal stress UspA family protein
MATHGRSGIRRFMMGSVAEKVLRGGTTPLLLVRAGDAGATREEPALKSIVVPLDGSELAETVLPAVEALAKPLNLAVMLFRAYAIPYGAYSTGDGFYDPVHLDSFLAQLRSEASDYLEAKAVELRRRGIADVSCCAKEGLTADEVIKFAKEAQNNLVAMCSHGRSGVKRWALGSVTENVVRHSGDPVLVIRAAG